MSTEKHHYISQETVRDKYKGKFDHLKSYTKAIASATQTKIYVEQKKNKTIQFIITGQRKGVERALQDIEYEFESSYLRQPRSEAVFLNEGDHKKLLGEAIPCLLTEEALYKHNILTGTSVLRQFACEPCNHPWWRYVSRTKPVSTCNRCLVKYDALEREKEFGIGRYICGPCNNTFYARCEAIETHVCFGCNKLVGPPYVNPRFKSLRPPKRHGTDSDPPQRHKVINASTPHISTGSTIASSIWTQDLGEDIVVQLHQEHMFSAKDQYKPSKDDSWSREEIQPGFKRESEASPSCFSDFDSETEYSETGDLESDLGDMHVSHRRRRTASDSSDSSDEADKMSTTSLFQGSEVSDPDSGIYTLSNPGTKGESGSTETTIKNPSTFKAEYPGVAFSKHVALKKLTSTGGKIEGEGIVLIIPPGAILEEDEVDISIQACIGGPFELSRNLYFSSPVYLIEPPFVFHKHVTLHIKLFTSEDDYNGIHFITSPTKPELKEDTFQWVFNKLGTSELSACGGYGEVSLNHFCFCGFGSSRKHKLRYSAILWQPLCFTLPATHLIFTATVQHEVYIENLERYIKIYKEDFGKHSKTITFCKEKLSFTLPSGDVNGYLVRPDISPCEISREDVNYPKKNKKRAFNDISIYPPRIVITVHREDGTGRRRLELPIKLEGIEEEVTFNVFLAFKSSSSSIGRHSQESSSLSSDSTELCSACSASQLTSRLDSQTSASSQDSDSSGKPTLRLLLRHLSPVSTHWKTLAILLDLEGEINVIESDGNDTQGRFIKMLECWLRKDQNVNWRTICSTLEDPSIGYVQLSHEIKKKLHIVDSEE